MIEFQKVNKWFKSLHVLKDVDLRVDRGQTVCVVGPSGSGKSTLIRCVNRLEEIESGDILVGGESIYSIQDVNRHRARVGMVFQHFNLYPHLTALQNITLAPVKAAKRPKAEAEAKARELLERVGIPEKADSFPGQLSGGQKQRMAIARALAMEPEIMLFDEATSALDPEMIGEVLQVMKELANAGMTMIVVTHEMNFAREAADRVVFMEDGRLLVDKSPEAFFDNPDDERLKNFLSKVL